jgi:serine/threonine protein kinase
VSEGQRTASAWVGLVLDARYRIEGLLGEGGMGAVYSATDLRLEKLVAVKVMARELSVNPDALARFHREARVTSALGHPHIVQVLDFSTTPTGEPFLAMEFLEGEDLDHRLRRERRLPLVRVVHNVRQVASALAATHAKAIVHRDLKPGNISLVEAAGETDFVKVLDFGISKVRSSSTKLTRTASIMGTPNYMSPEQAKGKVEDIDDRTDQWALACIAWECLAGEGPFVGENVPSILFQIVHEPPAPLLSKVPGLSPKVQDVLLRALSKDKNQRFASVADFSTALEAVAAGAVPFVQSSVQRTVLLPADTAIDLAAGKQLVSSTTLSRSAGEIDDDVDDDLDVLPSSSKKRVWVLAAGGACALLLLAFLLLRPAPATPVAVSPPKSVPVLAPKHPEPTPAAVVAPPLTAPPTEADRNGNLVGTKPDAAVAVPKLGPTPEPKKPQPAPSNRPTKKIPPNQRPAEKDEVIWH